MTKREIKVKKSEFEKRKLTTLQHKLRIVLKCYTIKNFILNEEERTFSFNKTHLINKIQMEDKKTISGKYDIQEIDKEDILVIFTIF